MIKYLNAQQVIVIHDEMIQKFGGLQGIRDLGLLESAIEMPKASAFGQEFYPTIFDKAAVYLFHIVKNHPFNDGNKRTGAFVACVFLKINQIRTNFPNDKYEELVVETAEGKLSKQEIAKFFKDWQLI